MKTLLLIALALTATPAIADDHMIRPTCWEEKIGEQINRHCEVNRPQTQAAPRPSSPPSPHTAQLPPIEEGPPVAPLGPYGPHRGPFAPGFGYYSTLSPRYWPGAPPLPPPSYYMPPPYYGPPGIVIGIGPFSVVIP